MNYCKACDQTIGDKRAALGYKTCLVCGELEAKTVKHTIVPMHKSNYTVITDRRDLMGINNKGGFHR